MHRLILSLTLTALAGAVLPAAAQARTFCVANTASDCDQGGYTANGAGLEKAVEDSNAYVDISGANTIRVGPGTYERAGGYVVSTATHVIGAGRSTVIGATDSQVPIQSTTAGSSLSDLTVRTTASSYTSVGFTDVTDVRLTGPGSPAIGLQLGEGGHAIRVLVDPAGVTIAAIQLLGYGTVEDSEILVRSGAPRAILAIADTPLPSTRIHHVDVLNSGGAAGATGIQIEAYRNASNPAFAQAEVTDSIVRGFATSLARVVTPPCSGCQSGTADLSVRYSSFDKDAIASDEADPGTMTLGPGNLDDPAPLFQNVAAGNLRLRAGSPLIDRGNPAGLEPGEPTVDFAGGPRVIGGRSDIGALESPLPPDLTPPRLTEVSLRRTTIMVGGRTKVRYTLSEAATVRIEVDRRRENGTFRRIEALIRRGPAGKRVVGFSGSVGGKALKPGRYRLTLTPRDNAGNTGKHTRLSLKIVK